MRRLVKRLSWLAGIFGVVVVVWYYGPENIPDLIRSVGFAGLAGWTVATILARLIHAETTRAPLQVLGFPMRLSTAFWVGWLRTFGNQVFPTAGVVAYTQAIRKKVAISWSELVALAAPQFVLVAAALGRLPRFLAKATLWSVLRERGRACGVLLLNPSPASNTIELVYIGLARSAQGQIFLQPRNEPFIPGQRQGRGAPTLHLIEGRERNNSSYRATESRASSMLSDSSSTRLSRRSTS